MTKIRILVLKIFRPNMYIPPCLH